MSPEYGEQKVRVCPKKRRDKFWRGVAIANGARVPIGSQEIDTECPPECPGSIKAKLLGINLPEFMAECPIAEDQ